MEILESVISWSAIPAPLLVFLIFFFVIKYENGSNRIFVSFIFFSSALVFFISITFGLFLRDGLASGFIPSNGFVAFYRTIEVVWPGLITSLILAIIGILFLIKNGREYDNIRK